jgi:hypothetical protein
MIPASDTSSRAFSHQKSSRYLQCSVGVAVQAQGSNRASATKWVRCGFIRIEETELVGFCLRSDARLRFVPWMLMGSSRRLFRAAVDGNVVNGAWASKYQR